MDVSKWLKLSNLSQHYYTVVCIGQLQATKFEEIDLGFFKNGC